MQTYIFAIHGSNMRETFEAALAEFQKKKAVTHKIAEHGPSGGVVHLTVSSDGALFEFGREYERQEARRGQQKSPATEGEPST